MPEQSTETLGRRDLGSSRRTGVRPPLVPCQSIPSGSENRRSAAADSPEEDTLKRSLSSIAVAAALLSAVVPAGAEDPRTFVVTASRVEEDAFESPSQVTVITAEDIERSGAQSVVEALRSIAGIEFRSYSGDAQAEVSMRGFGKIPPAASWSWWTGGGSTTRTCRPSTGSRSPWRTLSASKCSRAPPASATATTPSGESSTSSQRRPREEPSRRRPSPSGPSANTGPRRGSTSAERAPA